MKRGAARPPTGLRRWRWGSQAIGLALPILLPALAVLLGWSSIQGGYQSLGAGPVWVLSPLEAIESVLASRSLPWTLIVGALPLMALAIVMGRVFCSWVCPVNTLQELTEWLARTFLRYEPRDRLPMPRKTIWIVLVADLVLAFAFSTPWFAVVSPPGLVSRAALSAWFFGLVGFEVALVAGIVTLSLVTRRWFCRGLCPLGGLLGVLGARRVLNVTLDAGRCTACGLCDSACPIGLVPSRGESSSLECWNCGECLRSCHRAGLKIGFTAPRSGLKIVEEPVT